MPFFVRIVMRGKLGTLVNKSSSTTGGKIIIINHKNEYQNKYCGKKYNLSSISISWSKTKFFTAEIKASLIVPTTENE